MGNCLVLGLTLTDDRHYHTEVAMAKYVLPVLFMVVIAVVLTSGCYSAKEPLVVIGDLPGSNSSANDDSNTSGTATESDQVHSLRKQLANANKKCRDLEADKEELKHKLKQCEKKVDNLEEEIKDLQNEIKDLRKR
jgi:peptidoglycan hydrolase CwlO-like protein